MAGFWEGFTKELSRWTSRMGEEQLQRGAEQRQEERQMRMFGEQLKMREPFEIRSQERMLKRQKELAQINADIELEMQKNKQIQGAELEAVLYDEELMKMRKKAISSNNPIAQAYWTMFDRELGKLRQGKIGDISPEFIAGLPFVAQQKANQIILEHKRYEEQLALKRAQIQNEADRLQAYLQAQQELSRQRGDIGVTREINRLQDLEAPIAKAQKGFLDVKRELMNKLKDEGIINTKGQITKGKNIQLYNSETKTFNEDAKARLLKYYPHYQMWFETLDAIQAQLAVYEDMKEKFKAEKPTGRKDEFGFTVGQERKTPDGATYKYIGNNQWQLVK